MIISSLDGEREIKHVALYLRISREKKSENVETLQNHREILSSFAKENGLTFVEYGEVLSGGKSEMNQRPQLERLLRDIEQFDGILCFELSRISRNGLISQTVKQFCMDYDKPILTPVQVYDLANSENDRLMYDFGSIIASHEHGTIGKRSKANKIQMTKQGLHVSGNIPFGYIRNPKTKKLEIDEEAAKTVRYIFQLHSRGLGSYKIRDILNDEGYKSATGKHFNLPSVKRIIRNPTYKGWTIFNDRKRTKKQGKVTYETLDTIVVKDTHPAIISPEEWDQANRDREMRIKKFNVVREKPATKSGTTMLKDLIYCQNCGRKMSIRKDSKSATGYTIKKCDYLLDDGSKCNNSGIRLTFIEEEILEELTLYKSKVEGKLKDIEVSGSTQIIEEQRQRLSQINKRIREVTEQEKKLIDLALSGIFSNEELSEKKQELLTTKNVLIEQREQLTHQIHQPSVEDEKDKLKEVIDKIDELPNFNPERANETLKTFIKKIHYSRMIPDEIAKLSTRNKKRQLYPYEIRIEYY